MSSDHRPDEDRKPALPHGRFGSHRLLLTYSAAFSVGLGGASLLRLVRHLLR